MKLSDWLTITGIATSSVLSLLAIGVGVVVAQRLDRENERREADFWQVLFSILKELLEAILAAGRSTPRKPKEDPGRGGAVLRRQPPDLGALGVARQILPKEQLNARSLPRLKRSDVGSSVEATNLHKAHSRGGKRASRERGADGARESSACR
jgi:hypothetical protein